MMLTVAGVFGREQCAHRATHASTVRGGELLEVPAELLGGRAAGRGALRAGGAAHADVLSSVAAILRYLGALDYADCQNSKARSGYAAQFLIGIVRDAA
jgi:hypothetical protein